MRNTPKQDEEPVLYQSAKTIYTRKTHGLFTNLQSASVLILLGIYYGLPWLQWDGSQALLFDLPARKFYFFGIVFWPQDVIYLTLLLIIAAMSLFFFTSLAGRLWCGFACPQTVWTKVFVWMEHWTEGDRPKQLKLDKLPWTNGYKLRVKLAKHALWLTFAFFTGYTFVGYFVPITDLTARMLSFTLTETETFWVLFYAFATWGNAGFLREQICIYMCPYARFQSAMFDKDTMIIAYDEKRGEPRGARKKGVDLKQQGLGECIQCTMCVQVCPVAIDIRDGLQYQCISCSACIDACNNVMDEMNYPRGLIRYTTEHNLSGGQTHVIRPRLFVYAGLLLLAMVGLVYSVANRIPVGLDVIRDRNSLYRENSVGHIENVYLLRIMNMDDKAHEYSLTVSGLDKLTLHQDRETIRVESGEVFNLPVRLEVPPESLQGAKSSQVAFTLSSKSDPTIATEEESRFLGPMKRR